MLTTTFLILIGIGVFIFMRSEDKKEKRKRMEEEVKRKKEIEEENERKNIEKRINDLENAIIKDWNASIYPDKVQTPGDRTVIYKFENGDTVFLKGDTLIYTTSRLKTEYTLGLLYQNKFRIIFNKIVKIINDGKTATRSQSYSYSHGGKTPIASTSTKTNSNNPRQRRYNIIMETIKLRKESLNKMSKNDSSRAALERELEVAEKKANEIKKELQQTI